MYQPFYFPDSAALNRASRKEARDWFDYFISHIPERLKVLEEYVQTRIGYERWCLAYDDSTALDLQTWFESEITTRPKTEKELRDYEKSIPDRFKGHVKIDKPVFDDKTKSVNIDIAIYFGEYVRKESENLKWLFYTKKDINYQNPVIGGENAMALHPRWIINILAYDIVSPGMFTVTFPELKRRWLASLLYNKV